MEALPPVTAQTFDEAEAEAIFAAILDQQVGDAAIGAFLVALSDRGETASEIAGAARAMRARVIPVAAPDNAIDVCGTGGDGQHSLNVSTAVAIVVAACDVPVAKHGNRAASSKAGAADTLEALGLNLAKAGEYAAQTLADIGIAFLFAQSHHPCLKHIAPIRKALGRRTIFNLMGPLANPAGVTRQLVGIARPAYVPIYAQALMRLGTGRSFVVSGDEGLDELSLAGGNEWADIAGDTLAMKRVCAADAGLDTWPMAAIRGGDAAYNAAALRRLLMGLTETEQDRAYRDAVLFNAAGALMVAGAAADWREGVEEAAEAIDKGLAKGLLDCWIKACS
ncbi:anthranilate phosphoribosyltransferase [Novosphingobium sp. FSY-8]|uniref:Anthranilate phosphoribosyltransferase n=1 Tax=Novosphingobium ovatum TaxID=1908523 RepID=A0ABW9XC63_9SPHN|nr:anthranilate phosphoribosyltransferase [Novosphingobium ovatum]NBC36128.1 anthranilate phosphoribosyltransferase [Novosphingobium ovatum]